MLPRRLALMLPLLACLAAPIMAAESPLNLTLRKQVRVADGLAQFHTVKESQSWNPRETAIILCDVWDSHTCENAVKRVNELSPRLNEVVIALRKAGVTVIHAPSNCMDSYKDHPARKRAKETPKSKALPAEIEKWCYKIPAEEQGVYPIDQSDGGCDDEPGAHAAWTEKIIKEGRDPKRPWQKQTATIVIDDSKDYVTDLGDEVWSILETQGVKNVIIAGVHTNMCVLGRPFGLRQMSKNGKNVVLLRDMTDTMYNPKSAPYVSHFTGTDLIVSHIERFVCATITSDQIIGGKTFRFSGDTRPHVVVIASEPEYDTARTLTEFAAPHLGKDFRVTHVYGDAKDENELPGLEVLKDADVLLLSARRRTLRTEQLELVRNYIAAGKPAVGIRTASHAFSLRKGEAPAGHAQWTELDAEVWGGHYTNHYGNDLKCEVTFPAEAAAHAIMTGVPQKAFMAGGSLYQTAPLASGTTVLMMGKVHAKDPEPVSWTFTRKDGGKSFYSSLGHKDDFANPAFTSMLTNAVYWAAGKTPAKAGSETAGWIPTSLPGPGLGGPFTEGYREFQLRSRVSVKDPGKRAPLWMSIRLRNWGAVEATINGHPVGLAIKDGGIETKNFAGEVPRDSIKFDLGNEIVLFVTSELDEDRKQIVESVTFGPGRFSTPLIAEWEFKVERLSR